MAPFYTRFPELAVRETRTVRVLVPGTGLPVGEYGFLEWYCVDDGCDCRRVLIQVATPAAPNQPLATINYGWESPEFYTRWMHGDSTAGREIAGASLDPLQPQSALARPLLEMFQEVVLSDFGYRARLARHYELFRSRSPSGRTVKRDAAGGTGAQEKLGDGMGRAAGRAGAGETDGAFQAWDAMVGRGYELSAAEDAVGASQVWLRAWDAFCELCDQCGFASLCEFDLRFRGDHMAVDWVEDLEMELYTASFRGSPLWETRIRVCEEFLRRFSTCDDLIRENMRRALAESWGMLGKFTRCDALFEAWLQTDPQWGWGWIGWADIYFFARPPRENWSRAEELLRRGLDVPDVRDRPDIEKRLAGVIERAGRPAEAQALRKLGEAGPSQESRSTPGTARPAPGSGEWNRNPTGSAPPTSGRAASVPKVGRNDPCPCGSGKKYKKCCGG